MSPYLAHLLGWFLPVIAVQWIIGWRILSANLGAITAAAGIASVYYSLTDVVAIHQGIWFFGEGQISGVHIGNVPVEEVVFFFLTAWLVAQSFVLFLPTRFRR